MGFNRRKIGLVGGISWVSTMSYYQYINEGVNLKLGGLNAAECVICSLNFSDVQERGWEHSYELLLDACESLKKSNVNAIALCANTAHLFADQLQEATGLPIISIIAETAKAVKKLGLNKAGLLGTQFTMEMDFYREKLESQGISVLIPEKQETRDYMQQTLRDELGIGQINPATKEAYITIAGELIDAGAECILLGCTEIPLLIDQADFSVPVLDTTKIHSQAIVEYLVS